MVVAERKSDKRDGNVMHGQESESLLLFGFDFDLPPHIDNDLACVILVVFPTSSARQLHPVYMSTSPRSPPLICSCTLSSTQNLQSLSQPCHTSF